MGQALYRKYRSRSLDEIVGQKPVTTALENAIKSGHLSHAYLFTGPRGTGKTSIARILAFKINNIPYDSDNLPLDIIEIDAASNRRIDEIRDLRDKVNIAPVNAKYKVYIIDEVHMLTREAFNALLKTLEEPPEHVIFILATTEAHKLPETIISRTQRYTFQLATPTEVKDHLKNISKKEKINITDDALELLAKHSGGSMRDGLSLLDQVRHSSDKITADIIRLNLGLPTDESVNSILAALDSGKASNVIQALETAKADGASASLTAELLLQNLRSQILDSKTSPNNHLLDFMQQLLLVESSSKPDILLELALISAQLSKQPPQPAPILETKIVAPSPALTVKAPRPVKKHTVPAEVEVQIVAEAAPKPSPKQPKPSETTDNAAKTVSQQFNEQTWGLTLEAIRQDHSTLYSILRMAKPVYDESGNAEIRLLFKFPFHQKRINEAHNKQCILDCLAVNGVEGYEIICDLLPKDLTEKTPETITVSASNIPENTAETSDINQIRNVFGGAEVLE